MKNSTEIYINSIINMPYLTAEEELKLLTAFNSTGDSKFTDDIVTSHMRLVYKLARKYWYPSVTLEDLISEGTVGLLQAVQTFDVSRGFRFSTYARWWVRASILEYKMHNSSLVKIGTTAGQKTLYFNLNKVKDRLNLSGIKSLTPSETQVIADELEVSVAEVLDMNSRLLQQDTSLHTPTNNTEDSTAELLDYVEARETAHDVLYIEEHDSKLKKKLLYQAMGLLSDRERAIITARRLQEAPITLEELSSQYSISRERIRQIEKRVIEKLQDYIKNV